MLCKAYSNLSDLTDAKPGDKTLIDVLSPAIEAYESNKSDFKTGIKGDDRSGRERIGIYKNNGS